MYLVPRFPAIAQERGRLSFLLQMYLWHFIFSGMCLWRFINAIDNLFNGSLLCTSVHNVKVLLIPKPCLNNSGRRFVCGL